MPFGAARRNGWLDASKYFSASRPDPTTAQTSATSDRLAARGRDCARHAPVEELTCRRGGTRQRSPGGQQRRFAGQGRSHRASSRGAILNQAPCAAVRKTRRQARRHLARENRLPPSSARRRVFDQLVGRRRVAQHSKDVTSETARRNQAWILGASYCVRCSSCGGLTRGQSRLRRRGARKKSRAGPHARRHELVSRMRRKIIRNGLAWARRGRRDVLVRVPARKAARDAGKWHKARPQIGYSHSAQACAVCSGDTPGPGVCLRNSSRCARQAVAGSRSVCCKDLRRRKERGTDCRVGAEQVSGGRYE